MLRLVYTPQMSGAPAGYGDAEDTLAQRNGAGEETVLQHFHKAGPEFVAANQALHAAIDVWLAGRADQGAPVIVLVHGFQYDPDDPRVKGASPFDILYGLPSASNPAAMSWLPLVGECDETGGALAECAIAFAYKSEGSPAETNAAGWSNSYQLAVFDLAPLAARVLASILDDLGQRPGLTIRLLAHSLGTRTTSRAVGILRDGRAARIDRAVLLDGAEFSADAAVHFASCGFDVFNIVNRRDQVLNKGADEMCHPFRQAQQGEACVIGRDGLGGNPRWCDLRVDDPAVAQWFARGNAPDGVAYPIEPLARAGDPHGVANLQHWGCYTNPANRPLLRALLARDAMTVAGFQAQGVPALSGCPMAGTFGGVTPSEIPDDAAGRRAMDAAPRHDGGLH